MANTVDICRLALLRVGVNSPINSLNEATKEARACNAVFDICRQSLLSLYKWQFATRRSQLALLSGVARDGWKYAYGLPTDCLSPRYIWSGSRAPLPADRIPYSVELADDGETKILLCDYVTPSLVYTANIEAASLFSPLFVNALAWAVAVELSTGLPIKPDLRAQAAQGLKLVGEQAAAQDMNESFELPPDPPAIAARS